MLTEQQFQDKWYEIRNGIRNLWGQVSEEELEKTKGNLHKVSEIVHVKSGETIEAIEGQLEKLMDSFDNETDKHPEDIGTTSYQRSPLDRSEQNARH